MGEEFLRQADAIREGRAYDGALPEQQGAEFFQHRSTNGISDVVAPINSLIGVFLGPNQPSLGAAPSTLDFSSIGLGFSSLSPQLQQTFFIGDGLTGTASGNVQRFIVPSGATRLFLGTMDGGEWNNNSGAFGVSTVPEPAEALFLALGLIVLLVRSYTNGTNYPIAPITLTIGGAGRRTLKGACAGYRLSREASRSSRLDWRSSTTKNLASSAPAGATAGPQLELLTRNYRRSPPNKSDITDTSLSHAWFRHGSSNAASRDLSSEKCV